MRLFERVFLGLRERNVLLSSARGSGAHEVLKARRGKDELNVDRVAAEVGLDS